MIGSFLNSVDVVFSFRNSRIHFQSTYFIFEQPAVINRNVFQQDKLISIGPSYNDHIRKVHFVKMHMGTTQHINSSCNSSNAIYLNTPTEKSIRKFLLKLTIEKQFELKIPQQRLQGK